MSLKRGEGGGQNQFKNCVHCLEEKRENHNECAL